MDAAMKKRRMARELGPEINESASVPTDKANAFMLLAQNRALACNLFAYKRRIAELESSLSAQRASEDSFTDLVSVVHRLLAEVEASLTSLERRLHVPAGTRAEAAAEDPHALDGIAAPSSILARLMEANGGVRLASVTRTRCDAGTFAGNTGLRTIHSTISPACGGRSAAAAAAAAAQTSSPAAVASSEIDMHADRPAETSMRISAAQVDASVRNRISVLSERAAAVLSALDQLGPNHTEAPPAPVSALQAAADELQFGSGLPAAMFYRDLAAVQNREVDRLRRQLADTSIALAAAERTLARIEYDHPDLDVDAHRKGLAPHGIAPNEVPLASAQAVAGAAASAAGNMVAVASAPPTPVAAPPAPLAASQLSASTSLPPSAPIVVPESSQDAAGAAALASLQEEVATLTDERNIMKELADDRLREADELRAALAALSSELAAARAGVTLTEAAVVSSPWFIAKISELTPALQRAIGAESAATAAKLAQTAAQERAAAAEKRASEMLAAVQSSDQAVQDAVSAAVVRVQAQVDEIVAARDRALEQAAAHEADAKAANVLRAQSEENAKLAASLQQHCAQYRSDWAAVVAARVPVQEVLDKLKAAGDAGSAAAALHAEIAALKAEKEQLMAMIESLSQGYEEAAAQSARATAALQDRDDQIVKLQGQVAQAGVERSLAQAARAGLQQQIDDATASSAAARAALAAQARVLESLRESISERDARIQTLQAEVAAATARADMPTAASPHQLAMQVDQLNQQVQNALAQIAEFQQRLVDADSAIKRAQEEVGASARASAKKDEKITKLREKLLAAERAANDSSAPAATPTNTPGLRRAMSTPASSAASGEEEERGIAVLKEQQLSMLRAMLECSVCHKNHKNVVITKCYHLFCRECIENNLKIRHRKCPACGQLFGADDVKSVYFAS